MVVAVGRRRMRPQGELGRGWLPPSLLLNESHTEGILVLLYTVESFFQGILLKNTVVMAGWLKWDFCVHSH